MKDKKIKDVINEDIYKVYDADVILLDQTIRNPNISLAAKGLYAQLCRFHGEKVSVSISIQALQANTEKQIRDAFKELEDWGILKGYSND